MPLVVSGRVQKAAGLSMAMPLRSERPKIKTPRGVITINDAGIAELRWFADFAPEWQAKYDAAQRFVDSEVLRLCEPYTPMRTGMLIKSGILGTEVGSGTVSWIAPYSRAQYYLERKRASVTGTLRGSFWFERMKAAHGSTIIAGAKTYMTAGGGL